MADREEYLKAIRDDKENLPINVLGIVCSRAIGIIAEVAMANDIELVGYTERQVFTNIASNILNEISEEMGLDDEEIESVDKFFAELNGRLDLLLGAVDSKSTSVN